MPTETTKPVLNPQLKIAANMPNQVPLVYGLQDLGKGLESTVLILRENSGNFNIVYADNYEPRLPVVMDSYEADTSAA